MHEMQLKVFYSMALKTTQERKDTHKTNKLIGIE